MTDADEEFRSTWLAAPLALRFAEERCREIGGIDEPIGQRILTLAALGKLPVVAMDIEMLQRMSDAELSENEKARSEMDSDSYYEWLADVNQKRRDNRRKDLPKYRLVNPRWFDPLIGRNCGDFYINHTQTSFRKEGYFQWALSKIDHPYNAPVTEVFGDPDLRYQSIRGVYFLLDGLYHVTAPAHRLNELDEPEFDLDISDFVDHEDHDSAAYLFRTKYAGPASGAKQINVGGRRGALHGEAITQIVLQLLKLSPEQLERYTSESLSLELKQAYSRVGGAPPSESNLSRYAAGILRTLRK